MGSPSGKEAFLRSAIKAGLRMQRRSSCDGPGTPAGEGVATLQRIKASLARHKPKPRKRK